MDARHLLAMTWAGLGLLSGAALLWVNGTLILALQGAIALSLVMMGVSIGQRRPRTPAEPYSRATMIAIGAFLLAAVVSTALLTRKMIDPALVAAGFAAALTLGGCARLRALRRTAS